MKKMLYLWIGLALLSPGAHAELPRITVRSNQFVTPDGRAIVLRGLDTSDPDKLQRNDQWNKHYFDMAKEWGANIVRFPVHPAAWRLHGKDNYLRLLDEGVTLAREQGLYVIIDWHSIGNLEGQKFLPGTSELYPPKLYDTTKEETLEFWRTMARHYSGDPTVAFFELFNEPATGGNLGTNSWALWKGFMEEVITVVRAEGGRAVPLVAGFNYGYDLTPVGKAPINAEGIGYVSHPYPMKAKQPWETSWTHDWGFVADKYPLILTEFDFVGADDKKGYNPIIGDESYGEAIISYCAQRGISYTLWCFDPQWEPSLIKDWTFTPTRQGLYFKKAMQAKEPATLSTQP